MWTNNELCFHAKQRCNKRGYRKKDIDLVLEYGDLTKDGVMLTRQNAALVISEHKKEIQALERLAGTFVVLNERSVTTVYRPSKRKQRRQLQR